MDGAGSTQPVTARQPTLRTGPYDVPKVAKMGMTTLLATFRNSRKISDSVCIVFIVLTIGGLSLSKIDWGEEILHDGYFFHDDFFYYAEIARNFHDTGMFSFDGITSTNGFHFLWQVLLVLLYGAVNVLGLDHKFLHAIAIANIAVILASGLLLFILLRPVVGRFVSVAIVTSSMLLYSTLLLNGMETSLTLLACLVVVIYVQSAFAFDQKTDRRSRINSPLLAILLFLVFLARVDAVAFILAFMLALYVCFPGKEIRNALAFLLVLVGIYAALNYAYFDSAWPISGKVKAFWAQHLDRSAVENYHFAANYAGQNVMGILVYSYRTPPWLGDMTLFVAALLLSLFVILWNRRIHGRTYIQARILDRFILPSIAGFSLIAYLITQLLYYAIFSSSIRDWYLGAGMVGLYVTILTLLFMLFHRISGAITIRSDITTMGLASGLLAIAIYGDHTIMRDVSTRIQDGSNFGKMAIVTIEWIGENTEKKDIFGTWAAGQVGYYSDRSVVNLEGLVGDVELLEANRENTLIDYIDRKNISYISQRFTNKSIDESTGYPKENIDPGSLLDLRARLIYQDTGRFELVEVIPITRNASIYIYRVIRE